MRTSVMPRRAAVFAVLYFLLAALPFPAFAASSGLEDAANDPDIARALGQVLLQSQGLGADMPGMASGLPGFPAMAPQQSAARPTRTFDELHNAELDALSRVTFAYYRCVSDKTAAVVDADASSPERIFATYPPYIFIMRQQCRIGLVQVEKELYRLRLNPEFITNHVNTLRDDVVHFALQEVLARKKAAPRTSRAGGNGAQPTQSQTRQDAERTAPPRTSALP